MPPVRWGLLSTARINRRVIPAIRASKQGQLVAVASRDIHKAQQYAAEWSIPRAYGSYMEMLSADDIDAVYLSLPNHLHAEWTVKALEAGKHVLCEKPFALSVTEVDQMIEASRRTGRVLAEAFMYRHHPQTRLLGDYIRSGRLGEVTLMRGCFSFFMQNRAGNVRLDPNCGGGALWDVGIYPLSVAQFVFGGLPTEVVGQQWLGETGVDESFAAQLLYANGRSAQISGSFRIPFFTEIDVHGTLGRLTFNRPFTGMNEKDRRITFTPIDGETQKLRVKSIDPYLGEIEDMHAAILENRPTLISLEESRRHIMTAAAVYQSANSGQMVRLR